MTPPRRELLLILLLCVLGYVLFFHELGARDLWAPDEDEYAQVNREMVEDGHWLYPTLDGKPYSIKPPLFNWLGSLASLPGGRVTVWTSRLPAATSALLALLLTYLLGKSLFGPRAGFIAAIALGANPLTIEFARWIQINAPAMAFLLATLTLFWWGYTDERRRTLCYVLMYVPVGLGTLNMGPVAVVMPTLAIGSYLLVRRDVRHIFQLRLGWGLPLYALVAFPWYLTVSVGDGYARDLLVVTNFTRYFNNWHHVRPAHYYLTKAPLYFLPWTLFLPAAVALWIRKPEDRAALLFPVAWAGSLLLFFSFSETKRIGYLLPAFPALALIVGYALDRALDADVASRLWRRGVAAPGYLVGFAMLAAGIGLPLYVAIAAPDWLGSLAPFGVLLVLGGLCGAILLWREARGPALASMALFLVVSIGYAAGPVVSKINEVKSTRPFSLKVDATLPDGDPLRYFRYYTRYIQFYSEERRPVEIAIEIEELEDWFRSEAPAFAVTKEKEYLRIADSYPGELHVVLRERVDHRYLVLLSNRPASSGASGASGAGGANATGE